MGMRCGGLAWVRASSEVPKDHFAPFCCDSFHGFVPFVGKQLDLGNDLDILDGHPEFQRDGLEFDETRHDGQSPIGVDA